MNRYVRPADQLAAQDHTSPIVTAIHLALILLAYALAGASDMREEERLTLEGYINAHATVASVADGGEQEPYPSLRMLCPR